jgi:hypothetical protein
MKTEFAAASDIEAHLIGWVDETRTNKKLGPVLRPHNEVLRFYRQYFADGIRLYAGQAGA